ncbi:hypothetical protein RvY_01634 [Ramazzottius varieornatus]|uniref:Uncharacterized protein n=1 Tax=Ramazzottius varieornatus TaxID=947166 RepID=A0A1D1UH96_RAMVA|nr:hypothetical protein RvY_01634 [Ramazzottius varieornatus]
MSKFEIFGRGSMGTHAKFSNIFDTVWTFLYCRGMIQESTASSSRHRSKNLGVDGQLSFPAHTVGAKVQLNQV